MKDFFAYFFGQGNEVEFSLFQFSHFAPILCMIGVIFLIRWQKERIRNWKHEQAIRYVLAFALFGIADLFSRPFSKKIVGYTVGAMVVTFIRFVCSFLSGILLWGSYAPEGQPVWLYSLTYNGGYMIPNMILTGVIIAVLCAAIDPKTLRKPIKA